MTDVMAPTRSPLPRCRPKSMNSWGSRETKTRVLFAMLLVPAGLLALETAVTIIAGFREPASSFALMRPLCCAWPRFLGAVSPPDLIYSPASLFRFERAAFGPHGHYEPFAYPPTLILLIRPLALIPVKIALAAWMVASVTSYFWACWHRRWAGLIIVTGLLAPSTLAVVFYAQLSLLAVALLVGGLRLTDRRPILAGLLFGLASVKPQLGILVPVALISAQQWRAVASAAATALILALASGVVVGWTAWAKFPTALAVVSHYVTTHPRLLMHLSPTVHGGLRMMGVPDPAADVIQFLVAGGVATIVWRSFRTGITQLGIALVLTGTILATPYAFFYDLALTSYAVVTFIMERYDRLEKLSSVEVTILVLVLALPALMLFGSPHIPWAILVLPAFFGIVWRGTASGPSQNKGITPEHPFSPAPCW
jgi:Glycosyltransferase family 87